MAPRIDASFFTVTIDTRFVNVVQANHAHYRVAKAVTNLSTAASHASLPNPLKRCT